jgi:NAD(P)-dependent dehydrogenase (short-subunit alcohol dehydrogenase family)
MLVEGQSGIVTGAAGGIGRAAAVAYASEGASVVLADLPAQKERLEETAAQVEALGGRARVELMDVTDLQQQRRAVEAAVREFGALDFAFNNAGVEQQTAFADITEEAFDWVMGINTKGVFLGMKAQLEAMAPAGRGVIVNMASAAGILGLPGYSGYAASKHAVVGLTRSVAVEYAAQGIRINAVAPGAVDSPMLAELSASSRDELVANQAMKRLGDPAEIAEAVVWLTSSRSSYITGIALPIDGGLSAF